MDNLNCQSQVPSNVVCRSHIWGSVYWNGWTGFTHGRDLAGRVDLLVDKSQVFNC